MKFRNYIKKANNRNSVNFETFAEGILTLCLKEKRLFKKNLLLGTSILIALFLSIAFICKITSGSQVVAAGDNNIALFSTPIAEVAVKKSTISIPQGTVKANPFLPSRELGNNSSLDVPTYTLIEPPDSLKADSDAARVMDTIVSGILYDKYSPSAILNIEGNDYLVKKGDIVNNYKIINIAQDSVTVKLGANVYKAGIGEILTEGSLNYNEVSNLNNKFGGER